MVECCTFLKDIARGLRQRTYSDLNKEIEYSTKKNISFFPTFSAENRQAISLYNAILLKESF